MGTGGFDTLIGSLNSYSLPSAPRNDLRQLFPAASGWKEAEIGYTTLREQYTIYKESYVNYKKFDPKEHNLSVLVDQQTPLEELIVFFDTGTYDEIERDVKVTMEAQLGLIGGTMGLLTGFSILSGVEIAYYLLR